ncbi:hypothetical protein EVAR_48370_1 [Eumeta japonica]|uniref:Uncharacterized protein n=1 Tax=Eumeta variegata TaxID=151549 RepID=A0A4C1WMD1_EUMVA|nr:hypothetical protein EVAR_48370_1 [Eumeta japonica]
MSAYDSFARTTIRRLVPPQRSRNRVLNIDEAIAPRPVCDGALFIIFLQSSLEDSKKNLTFFRFYRRKTSRVCVTASKQIFPDDLLEGGTIQARSSNLSDEFRDGRPSTAVNNKNIDAMRRMIKTNRHVTHHEIRASLGVDIS